MHRFQEWKFRVAGGGVEKAGNSVETKDQRTGRLEKTPSFSWRRAHCCGKKELPKWEKPKQLCTTERLGHGLITWAQCLWWSWPTWATWHLSVPKKFTQVILCNVLNNCPFKDTFTSRFLELVMWPFCWTRSSLQVQWRPRPNSSGRLECNDKWAFRNKVEGDLRQKRSHVSTDMKTEASEGPNP